MNAAADWQASALGLAAALGGGLLIGLDRERRKGQGESRRAAGIRSFALAALGGGIAQTLQQPLLVLLGGALVAVLVAVAYWKSRESPQGRPSPGGEPVAALQVDGTSAINAGINAGINDGSHAATRAATHAAPHAAHTAAPTPAPDPGLTTELALFVTYLVGVLSVQQPALGAGAAAAVAALLAARDKLHRFATEKLSEAELHDALLLAALVLVLLPLAPATPVAALGGLVPRTLLLTAVLILALQAAGHVALRVLGARAGLALSGLFSGFVSSTATIASLGARARAHPAERAACLTGAMFSTTATWLQVLMLVGALAPAALPALLPLALTGAAVALGTALLQGWHHAPADVQSPGPTNSGPLRLREALVVAGLLAVVALGVAWAQRHFGSAGLLLGTGLAALVDAHAPVAALATLQAAGTLGVGALAQGVLVAVATNSVTRAATAVAAGGWAYGLRVAASLLASTGAAAAVGLALAL